MFTNRHFFNELDMRFARIKCQVDMTHIQPEAPTKIGEILLPTEGPV